MGKDYYKILKVSKDATDDQITERYHKKLLKYHARKHKSPGAEEKFKKIAEAFEVLSDKDKRAVYDKYGEEGLKAGGGGRPGPSREPGVDSFPSSSNADPLEMFRHYVGGNDHIDSIFSGTATSGMPYGSSGPGGRMFPTATHLGASQMDEYDDWSRFVMGLPSFSQFGGQQCQDPAVVRDLSLSLEEIYHGVTKRMKITKQVLDKSGHLKTEEKVLLIDVKPGSEEGTKITFPRESDQNPDSVPADIVFVIKDKYHDQFKRDGSDIIHEVNILLCDALSGATVLVPMIEGGNMNIDLEDVITPNYKKRIVGKGLPLPKEPGARGDMLLEFNIIFPDHLSDHSKCVVREVLPP